MSTKSRAIHEEATELLLQAITQESDDGLMASFFYGRQGAPLWDRHFGVEIFYQRRELVRAALFVRRNGPPYLRYLSVSDIWSMLQNFVSENYWPIGNETFLRRFKESFAENVSPKAKADLADALANSPLFSPTEDLALFPLTVVKVQTEFNSRTFFLAAPKSLNAEHLPEGSDPRWLLPDQFPPIRDWKGKREVPSSWLGIRSPAKQAADKMKAAILGGIALTPLPRYRHLFSGRPVAGGLSLVSRDKIATSFGEPHTPALMHDVVITELDHEWLSLLASKLDSGERKVRRELYALEYFYRAWALSPSERFAILCMTLDAIFGDANHATQAVIDGVRSVLGGHVADKRLRNLMDLRASVIHGGAPDVYDSRKYARYYDDYDADPIHDLELIVGKCLRVSIFGDRLREHTDPNAAIIAEAQAKGRLPKNLRRNTILDPAQE